MTTTDQLAAIQAPVPFHKLTRQQLLTLAIALQDQRDNALALVRERDAAIERVKKLHRGNRWGYCEACSEHVNVPMPCPTVAALTATEGAESLALDEVEEFAHAEWCNYSHASGPCRTVRRLSDSPQA